MTELAEIFCRHGSQYREKYNDRMPFVQRQAMQAIEQCRTEVLGGHVYHCQDCDEVCYSYHSCKNRHCPKCQNKTAEEWLTRQKELLLPVPYFMVTFTLPSNLRGLVRSKQKLLYGLLFRTSAAALQELARDPKFVGGQIGMVGVLHTWTRELHYHPHVHFLVPAGGLSEDNQTWHSARNGFLVPVKPLSILFRAKFRDALKKTEFFSLVSPEIWQQDWVVHSQAVGSGVAALKYLAPYIFRVAISNKRILCLKDGHVTFRYKASDTGRMQKSKVTAEEFIRRFLQHVLPKGFIKVRYYGLFSPGNRHRLRQVRQLLNANNPITTMDAESTSTVQQAPTIRCPKCDQPMEMIQTLKPQPCRPP